MNKKESVIPPASSTVTIPIRYPWAFAALFIPMLISIATGCYLWKPDWFFCFPLVILTFFIMVMIEGWKTEQVTNKRGVAYTRKESPFHYWFFMVLYLVIYILFALFAPIYYAIQEREKPPVVKNTVSVYSPLSCWKEERYSLVYPQTSCSQFDKFRLIKRSDQFS